MNPILVGDDHVIAAGHRRLMAAQQLGLDRVAVIVLEHLTETQRRALVVADNRLADAEGWTEELLHLELSDLNDLGFDLDLIGFSDEELDNLLNPPAADNPGLTDEDEVPEPEEGAEPRTKPGDLWTLGDQRVLCGDATNPDDMARLMDGQLAEIVFMDPPYNVNYGDTAKDKMRRNVWPRSRKILNDNLGTDFGAFLAAAMANLLAVTKGAVYVCMSSSELDTLQKAFRSAGGKRSTFIIWAKNTFTLGRSDCQRQYEPILYGWPEGLEHYWCGDRNQGDVWFVNKPLKNDLHPTMKPVELDERAVRNSSKSRDIVLDPFGGSGSTLIACEKAGRRR